MFSRDKPSVSASNPRLRDLGVTIGTLPPGPHNAITDVPDVWVGQTALIHDSPQVVRTGVTVILPRAGAIHQDHAFAGFFSFNGCGEMTGVHLIEEFGLLTSPIALTDTTQVGLVRDGLIQHALARRGRGAHYLGVVAETWGGWLSDRNGFALSQEHVFQALDGAAPGPVAEGNVGGGTAMICHDFKGGIGTASRVVEPASGSFTVGVLVQANHGDRHQLRVDGVAVGRAIGFDRVPSPWEEPSDGEGSWQGAMAGDGATAEERAMAEGRTDQGTSSSVIVVIATDAPLLAGQCKRLARRAAVGIARAGAVGHSGSGDLFLAFATGNHHPADADQPLSLQMLPHHHLDPLFDAVAEATEEAILNSLVAAETMAGFRGRTAHALPVDMLLETMAGSR